MIALTQRKVVARAGSAAMSGAFCHARDVMLPLLMAATLAGVYSLNIARAEGTAQTRGVHGAARQDVDPRSRSVHPERDEDIRRARARSRKSNSNPFLTKAAGSPEGCLWHGADIKPRPLFGRCGVESGHHLLGLSLSAFDPKRSYGGAKPRGAASP